MQDLSEGSDEENISSNGKYLLNLPLLPKAIFHTRCQGGGGVGFIRILYPIILKNCFLPLTRIYLPKNILRHTFMHRLYNTTHILSLSD